MTSIDEVTRGPIKTKVKWYNAFKGFGFVSPEGVDLDAFLHVSTLNRAGIYDILEGSELVCDIFKGAKGLQVKEIVEVVREVKPEAETPPASCDDNEIEVEGTVKWFKPNKGFGFAVPNGGDEDIFLHKNTLRKCGITYLERNQKLKMRVARSDKGCEATWISLAN